jgi:site-specific DNA recombinase
MFGNTRRALTYYTCVPAPAYRTDEHPPSVYVPEGPVLDGLNQFFTTRVFGPNRHILLAEAFAELDAEADAAHQARIDTVRRAVADLDRRRRQQIRALEVGGDEPDPEFIRQVRERIAELTGERASKQAEFAELETRTAERPNPALIDTLPVGTVRLNDVPEATLRHLFEAFRLEVHYDRRTNIATCRISLTGETIPAVQAVAQAAIGGSARTADAGDDVDTVTRATAGQRRSLWMRSVPPAGLEPAAKCLEGTCSIR